MSYYKTNGFQSKVEKYALKGVSTGWLEGERVIFFSTSGGDYIGSFKRKEDRAAFFSFIKKKGGKR